jgi:hypothetical protein
VLALIESELDEFDKLEVLRDQDALHHSDPSVRDLEHLVDDLEGRLQHRQPDESVEQLVELLARVVDLLPPRDSPTS